MAKNKVTKNTVKSNYTLRYRARRDEENPAYKTAALYAKSIVPVTMSEEDFQLSVQQKLQGLTGHRPILKVGSPSNTPLKRPKWVETPNHTILTREKCLGMLIVYSNNKVEEVARNEPEVIDEKVAEILKDTDGVVVKQQEIIVTPEVLDQAARDRKINKRGSKNVPDQNTCMAREGVSKGEASATKIAKLLRLAQEAELWEWLHLIAFFIKGRSAQTKKNMSGGTGNANTDMIFGEDELIYIVQELGKAHLLVTSTETRGSHFAKEITFTIITDYFILPFVFNARTSVKPSLRNKSYIHASVETLVEEALDILKGGARKRKLELDGVATTSISPTLPMMFFSTTGTGIDEKLSVSCTDEKVKVAKI